LDLNFEEVKKFVEKYIYTTLEGILKNKSIKDYKTLIQELSQARYNITPRYEVLKEE
jgi:dsRNA-specific ribonuclease